MPSKRYRKSKTNYAKIDSATLFNFEYAPYKPMREYRVELYTNRLKHMFNTYLYQKPQSKPVSVLRLNWFSLLFYFREILLHPPMIP